MMWFLKRSYLQADRMPSDMSSVFNVQYKPPGFISPGMTSSICVQFTPQVRNTSVIRSLTEDHGSLD